ncbi:MarR family winged helix-turn-helix transcriptional regulator [Mesobacillus maritimus]|uniref:MarR family winged helix-turn-helix transcriptional regulator n=1 Tax=Mesobacillus maritimus TaxID=1643336 RepID=UPI00384B9CFF
MERICTNLPFLVLMQTSKRVHDRIKEEMTKNKLSITEFSVLEVLYHKGRQTIQQIGKSILISSGSMTYVIDKLEERGLVSRNACPDDRRAIHVLLTDQGNTVMNEIMPTYHELVSDMFGSLSDDDAETFVQLLRKVKERV